MNFTDYTQNNPPAHIEAPHNSDISGTSTPHPKFESLQKINNLIRMDLPVTVLGTTYTTPNDEKFKLDWNSNFWFTYRSGFPMMISKQGILTQDAGWGCMHRTGQMLIGRALMTLALGRNWRLSSQESLPAEYGLILRLFEDHPDALLSIHKIAQKGTAYGKKVGDWFEPTITCNVMKELIVDVMDYLNWQITANPNLPTSVINILNKLKLKVYVTNTSRTIYTNEIKNELDNDIPILILIPLKLGEEGLNPIYIPQLVDLFSWQQFVGIIGGIPRSSFYFIGVQEGEEISCNKDTKDTKSSLINKHFHDIFFYLDPHLCRPYVNMTGAFDSASYHCSSPSAKLIRFVDPSMALGFLCKNKEEYLDFIKKADNLKNLTTNTTDIIFRIADEAPNYDNNDINIDWPEDDVSLLEDDASN